MLGTIRLGSALALLFLLVACGGKPNLPAAEPPGWVVVTPGPNVLHVVWLHDGSAATEYVVYREPRDGSAAKAELTRVPAVASEHNL